jgi:hypothetical protein
MSDDSLKAVLEAMEAKKARLLEQAKADIERAMEGERAELEALIAAAAKFNMRLVSADSVVAPPAVPAPAPADKFHNGHLIIADTEKLAPENLHHIPSMTFGALVEKYRTDQRSPYRELRSAVRDNYDQMIDRIVEEITRMHLNEISAETIEQLYKRWSGDGTKLANGHAMVTKLRLLFSFGTTTLDDPACQRLSTIMNRMRFAVPTGRSESLTSEQVNLIRKKAHELKRPSIALAQAIQFQLMLRQKDVIGEWVPVLEDWPSDIVRNDVKWVHGLRWEEIDENWILRHVTSFRQKKVVIDLNRAPMVMEEIAKIGTRPAKGPMILSEWNNLPWSSNEFRRIWRKIADAAGVPKSIKNMDSTRTADGKTNYTDKAKPAALPAEQQERSIH